LTHGSEIPDTSREVALGKQMSRTYLPRPGADATMRFNIICILPQAKTPNVVAFAEVVTDGCPSK
jgi:hypothetical protein